jgi:hypothetical protein
VTILVGAAIAIGFKMVVDQSASSNRDQLTSDLVSLAVRAQYYYRRPLAFGGGDKSFDGLTIGKLTNDSTSANGTYSIVGAASGAGPIRLRGVGKTPGNDGNPVKVDLVVFPDTFTIDPDSIN